jgi:hypothetical protein
VRQPLGRHFAQRGEISCRGNFRNAPKDERRLLTSTRDVSTRLEMTVNIRYGEGRRLPHGKRSFDFAQDDGFGAAQDEGNAGVRLTTRQEKRTSGGDAGRRAVRAKTFGQERHIWNMP